MKKIIIILLLLQTSLYSQVPQPPVFLGLDDSTSLTPKLLWSRVPNASSYGLQISTDPNFTMIILSIGNVPDTFYQVPAPLTYSILLYLRLNASNSYGTGPWSPVYSFILHPPIGIKPISTEVPDKFTLYQNYPNPFNPVTKIKFAVPLSPLYERGDKGGFVTLKVYDVLGREVSTLVNEQLSPGTYKVEWDARAYPSGVYFYKLVASHPSTSSRLADGQAGQSFIQTRKMILIK